MTAIYADTSAIVRAFLPDESEHAQLRETLLEAGNAVVTSELSRVEFARAMASAVRANRISDPTALLRNFDTDTGEEGPISLLRLRPERILPRAYTLVQSHVLGTLDAIHIVEALNERREGRTDLVLVTRDERQAAAARELGLEVA